MSDSPTTNRDAPPELAAALKALSRAAAQQIQKWAEAADTFAKRAGPTIAPLLERMAEAHQQAAAVQREKRAAFVRSRVEQWPEHDRPSTAELEDLDRRLQIAIAESYIPLHASETLGALEESRGSPLTRSAIRGFWEAVAHHYNVPLVELAAHVDGFQDASSLAGAMQAPLVGAVYELTLARVWPVVLHDWRRDHALVMAARFVLSEARSGKLHERGEADDGSDAEALLLSALKEHSDALRSALGTLPRPGVAFALAELDGMCELDAKLIGYLQPWSKDGYASALEDLAKRRRQAWATRAVTKTPPEWLSADTPAWLARWSDPRHPFVQLARALWICVVRPRLQREQLAREFRPPIVEHRGDEYAKMPKVAAPMSWAVGGPGMSAVELDSDRYALEPTAAAALLPRTYALLPADHEKQPHQTCLALEHGEPDVLPLAVAQAQGFVLSPDAGKLSLLFLASDAVRRGELARSTLGELAAWTHPGTKRIQARELRATAAGMDEARSLFLFLPDGTKVQVFDVQTPRTPGTARSDMVLHYSITRTFARALSEFSQRRPTPAWAGEFLVNLTGLMKLPNKEPTLVRHYIRAAAMWNAAFDYGSGKFDPAKLKGRTVDDFAILANTLPPAAVEYLRAKGDARGPVSRRVTLHKERKRVLDNFDDLAARALVRIEKRGDLYRLLPPEAHCEAWTKARAQGLRRST